MSVWLRFLDWFARTFRIGQRAIPAALERAGFQFHHNTIGEALSYATTQPVSH